MKKTSLIGSLASLGVIALSCYAIFGLFYLQNYEMAFCKALFMLLCLCIDAVIIMFCPLLSKTVTLPFTLAEISSAAIYTAAQVILFVVCFTAASVKIYVFFSLLFLLIFAVTAAVLFKAGFSASNSNK